MSTNQRSCRIILPGLFALPAGFSSSFACTSHVIFSHVVNPWVAGLIFGFIVGVQILCFIIAFKKRVLTITTAGLSINKRLYRVSEIQLLKYSSKTKFLDLKPTKGFFIRMKLRCDDRERTDILRSLKEWADENVVQNEGF